VAASTAVGAQAQTRARSGSRFRSLKGGLHRGSVAERTCLFGTSVGERGSNSVLTREETRPPPPGRHGGSEAPVQRRPTHATAAPPPRETAVGASARGASSGTRASRGCGPRLLDQPERSRLAVAVRVEPQHV